MSLKSYKPYTKSTRGTILVDKTGLWKGKPHKPLTSVNNSSKGRNNLEGLLQEITEVDINKDTDILIFTEKKFNMKAEVERIEYDPNRSCYIMLVKFEDE